jgi:hypothetical protein
MTTAVTTHTCGAPVAVDEWEEHVAACTVSGHHHTLTVTDTGDTFITEHAEDPGFTLLSGCYVFKVAHEAFARRCPHRDTDGPVGLKMPPAGVYRIAIGDDGNLHIFGRIGAVAVK